MCPFPGVHVQGWPEPYIYTWCTYSVFGREVTKCTVIYGVYVFIHGVFGREITKYTVIYGVFTRCSWQGNHQIYGHTRCLYAVFLAGKSPNIRLYTVFIHSVFGREITKYTVIYGVYTRAWPTLFMCVHRFEQVFVCACFGIPCFHFHLILLRCAHKR